MQTRKFSDCNISSSNLRPARLLLAAFWLGGLITALAIPVSPASAQREGDSADRAFEVFNRRCFQCHGANGVAKKNVFVLDRERLLASRVVVPGDDSSLLLRMVNSAEMPLGGPELTAEEKAALTNWVLAGAPA